MYKISNFSETLGIIYYKFSIYINHYVYVLYIYICACVCVGVRVCVCACVCDLLCSGRSYWRTQEPLVASSSSIET